MRLHTEVANSLERCLLGTRRALTDISNEGFEQIRPLVVRQFYRRDGIDDLGSGFCDIGRCSKCFEGNGFYVLLDRGVDMGQPSLPDLI